MTKFKTILILLSVFALSVLSAQASRAHDTPLVSKPIGGTLSCEEVSGDMAHTSRHSGGFPVISGSGIYNTGFALYMDPDNTGWMLTLLMANGKECIWERGFTLDTELFNKIQNHGGSDGR